MAMTEYRSRFGNKGPTGQPPVKQETSGQMLNDEARKLLEEKSKAAARASLKAAEAGAKKTVEAGKAALDRFSIWRQKRTPSVETVDEPAAVSAPMVVSTPTKDAEPTSELGGPEIDSAVGDGANPVEVPTTDGRPQPSDSEAEQALADYIEQRVQEASIRMADEHPGAVITHVSASGTTMLSATYPVTAAKESPPHMGDTPKARMDEERTEVPDAARQPSMSGHPRAIVVSGLLTAVFLSLATYYLMSRSEDEPPASQTQAVAQPVLAPVALAPVVRDNVPDPPGPTLQAPQVLPQPAAETPVEAAKPMVEVAAPAPVRVPVAENQAQPEPKVVTTAPKPVQVKKPAPKPRPATTQPSNDSEQEAIDAIRDFEKKLGGG